MIQRISEDLLWSQIVARAWCDEDFMKRLQLNPRAVLAEQGIEVAPGTGVEVVEGPEAKVEDDTEAGLRFILPNNPPEELTDEELVGGPVAWFCGACGWCGRCGCRCRC